MLQTFPYFSRLFLTFSHNQHSDNFHNRSTSLSFTPIPTQSLVSHKLASIISIKRAKLRKTVFFVFLSSCWFNIALYRQCASITRNAIKPIECQCETLSRNGNLGDRRLKVTMQRFKAVHELKRVPNSTSPCIVLHDWPSRELVLRLPPTVYTTLLWLICIVVGVTF